MPLEDTVRLTGIASAGKAGDNIEITTDVPVPLLENFRVSSASRVVHIYSWGLGTTKLESNYQIWRMLHFLSG